MVYVGPVEEVALSQANDRYREFRERRAALAKLSKQVLDLIGEIEEALALPNPEPAAGRSKRKDNGDDHR